jgi:xylose isomerase
MLTKRYASFDSGKGKEFEQGKMTLEDLRNFAAADSVIPQISGKQELIENILNQYLFG